MKIRLIRPYSTYFAGTVVDCEDAIAMRLVRDGIADSEDSAGRVETAAIDIAAERADTTPRKALRRAIQKPEGADEAGS